jgi:hypothetical protein
MTNLVSFYTPPPQAPSLARIVRSASWHMNGTTRLECQRCQGDEAATYRVHTDALDIIVCASCATEARKLNLQVGSLDNLHAISATTCQPDAKHSKDQELPARVGLPRSGRRRKKAAN